MTLVVQRRPAFYHVHVVTILHFITSLMFMTLLADKLGDMNDISLTLILTAVAFRFAINDKLPVCAYQTVLDKDMNANLAFLFFCVVENVLATRTAVPRWVSGGALGAMWVVYNVCYAARAFIFQRAVAASLKSQGLSVLKPHNSAPDSSVLAPGRQSWRVL